MTDGEQHDHGEHHGHGHGHAPERGWKAGFRYLKLIRKFWRSDVNDAVVDIVAPVGGEQVLDVGAGMGAGAVVAYDRMRSGGTSGSRIHAVDPLPGMRLFARARTLWPMRWRTINVSAGTAESLPLDDGVIDAFWATNALHHFDDIDAAAAELGRVTRSGGRAVMVEEQFTDPAHPSYERFGGDDHESHQHRFHAIDLDRVGAVFTESGFEVVRAEDTLVASVPVKLVELRKN